MEKTDRPESGSGGNHGGSGPPSYHYFVDGSRYESTTSGISGAEIKSRLPGPTNTFQLFQEGRGGDADRLVGDTESIDLDPSRGGVAKFYTAPNATFGLEGART